MEQIKQLFDKNHNIVILGGPGTAKTTNLIHLYNSLKEANVSAQCLAPTGIASVNLPMGQTVDHFFSFYDGRFSVAESFDRMSLLQKQKIRELQTIFIDEVSMLSAQKLDKVCSKFKIDKIELAKFTTCMVLDEVTQ